MARYEFYEIRSARNAESETRSADGVPLYRRSYVCAEREDLTLFVWVTEEGQLEAFQLLFREHFVSWARGESVDAGVTSRHDTNPMTETGQEGVRTLHDSRRERIGEILDAARAVLERAELPATIDGDVREALAAS